MKFLGIDWGGGAAKQMELEKQIQLLKEEVQKSASFDSGTIRPLGTRVLSYDGEKNIGEIGPPTVLVPDYYTLSVRSWQAYTYAPLAKTVISKWADWIIDGGLRLKTNPAKIVLKSEGIEMSKDQSEAFNDTVESRWDIFANSKTSSFNGEETFNEMTKTIYINAKIGGDILVILRVVNGNLKVQYIDGQMIQSPFGNQAVENGNIISNGVELTPTGSVVAYYVRKPDGLSFDRVLAYSPSTKLRVAFLVKGTKWRINYHRGMPVISTVLESIAKVDRYHEATVGSAEEVANIAYQVVHTNFSDGSSPLQQQLAKAAGFGDDANKFPADTAGELFANKIAVTTKKSAYNNPKGAEIKTINQGNNVSGFENFYKTNADIICACVGIPPNVAMSIYNDSFSASRAATKDWDHTMDIERTDLTNQFYGPIYKMWLFLQIAQNKVIADGYLKAFSEGNIFVTESYEKMRFTGSHFPHIDPLKEAKAEREKLGALGKNLPLTTLELATETLGGGDSDDNVEQFSDELKVAISYGLKDPEPILKNDPA
jgi:capsid protein